MAINANDRTPKVIPYFIANLSSKPICINKDQVIAFADSEQNDVTYVDINETTGFRSADQAISVMIISFTRSLKEKLKDKLLMSHHRHPKPTLSKDITTGI